MEEELAGATPIELAAEIVSAYVSHNSLPSGELPGFIRSVHACLGGLTGTTEVQPGETSLKPAIPIKKSVTQEAIVCLEDGHRFQSLKRHLASAHGMTPQEYRAKWGLRGDYPMIAPAYAGKRSTMARSMGLGRKPKAGSDTVPPMVTPVSERASEPAKAVHRQQSKPERAVAHAKARRREKPKAGA